MRVDEVSRRRGPRRKAGELRSTAGAEVEAGELRSTAGPEVEAGELRSTAGAEVEAGELRSTAGAVALVDRGVDSPCVIWILLVVLAVVGGVAAVGIAANERKKLPASTQKALPAGDKIERTVREVRVDDVITIDGKDFLCEGTINYDEDGHHWRAGRCVDGTDVRWVVVGIERAGTGTTRVLVQDESTQLAGFPPEALVIGDLRYTLDKRGTATCELRGDVGGVGNAKKEGTVERCRWWLYAAPGDDTLIVEQWGSDYRALRGKKVGDSTIELMPGS